VESGREVTEEGDRNSVSRQFAMTTSIQHPDP